MSKQGTRVLIVDDDEAVRRSLARVIQIKGYLVETASDGQSAIEMARCFQPDLLIMDIRMPGIDGVDAFEQIRIHDPNVAAIFMTAYSSSARMSRAEDLGAHCVLVKPLDVEALDQLVQSAVQ
ncbi:MAG: response regulator [Pirellulales bacterium]|nr:response regulator [Pirellulales bacterium]